jgi:hypothetical protein
MDSPEPPTTPRATITSFLLTGMCGMFFFGLLTVVTGGWFLILLAAFGVILLFAGIHYLLWGWLMEKEIRNQQEEEEDLRAKAPTEGWPLPDSDRYTRF